MARWVKDTLADQERSPKGFGQHVRSYVDGRGVKDSRTGVEADMQATLDGDLDVFLRASLASRVKP